MAEQNSLGDRISSSYAVDLLPENHFADGNKLSGSTATNEDAFDTLVQYGMQQTIDPSLLNQTAHEGRPRLRAQVAQVGTVDNSEQVDSAPSTLQVDCLAFRYLDYSRFGCRHAVYQINFLRSKQLLFIHL